MSNKEKEVDERLDELDFKVGELGGVAKALGPALDEIIEGITYNQDLMRSYLCIPWYKRIFKTYKEKK